MPIKVKLSEARDEYVRWSTGKGLAFETVKGYREVVEQLEACVGDILVENITHRHVDRLFATYPWSPGTRNKKVQQLRTFLAWARNRRYLAADNDPTYGWDRVRPEQREKLWIPVEDWGRLLDACVHPTERFVLGTGLYLFLRGSEQAARKRDASGVMRHYGLKWRDIDLNRAEARIYRVKTRQWDTLPLSAEVLPIVRDYMEFFASQVNPQPDHFLICPRVRGSMDRDPVTNQLVAGTGIMDPSKPHARPHEFVQRVLERCGYPIEFEGEHTLRRSGARALYLELLSSGYDGSLQIVSSLLSHSSVKTTETYLGVTLSREVRNDLLRNKPMFPSRVADNVVPIKPSVAVNE